MEETPHQAVLASRPETREVTRRPLRLPRRHFPVQKEQDENPNVLLEAKGGKFAKERRQRRGDADEILVI
jgi:hypothetical protein